MLPSRWRSLLSLASSSVISAMRVYADLSKQTRRLTTPSVGAGGATCSAAPTRPATARPPARNERREAIIGRPSRTGDWMEAPRWARRRRGPRSADPGPAGAGAAPRPTRPAVEGRADPMERRRTAERGPTRPGGVPEIPPAAGEGARSRGPGRRPPGGSASGRANARRPASSSPSGAGRCRAGPAGGNDPPDPGTRPQTRGTRSRRRNAVRSRPDRGSRRSPGTRRPGSRRSSSRHLAHGLGQGLSCAKEPAPGRRFAEAEELGHAPEVQIERRPQDERLPEFGRERPDEADAFLHRLPTFERVSRELDRPAPGFRGRRATPVPEVVQREVARDRQQPGAERALAAVARQMLIRLLPGFRLDVESRVEVRAERLVEIAGRGDPEALIKPGKALPAARFCAGGQDVVLGGHRDVAHPSP